MSTTMDTGQIPEWTRGDRLRKARQLTGLNTRDFAERVGVSQKTITDAENDKRQTRRILLNAWALATGVPLSWLETGQAPTSPDGTSGPDGGSDVGRDETAPDRVTDRYLTAPTLAAAA